MIIGIDVRLWSQTGVGRYIRNLCINLQTIDKKNEYVLFARSEDIKLIQNSEFRIQNPRWKIVIADIRWHSIKEQVEFPKILSKENLDLVHFPYFSVPIFYNKPFVVTIHDLIMHHFPTGRASTLPSPLYKAKRLGYEKIISYAVKKSNKIIVPLNAVKDDLIKSLNASEEKVVVTYEGIDDSLRIENLKLQNGKYGKYFLYVGNAYPHKNLERLIDAFELFEKNNKDCKLILVGKDDFFYKRLEKKVKETKLPSIIFLHNVTDEELSLLYKNATALISASLMEGFGLTAVEAISNNCLVLLSDILSFREVCGDGAVYFNPLSISDISKKLDEVFKNDKSYYKEKMGVAKTRLELFSWKKMSRETLKVYESCYSLR